MRIDGQQLPSLSSSSSDDVADAAIDPEPKASTTRRFPVAEFQASPGRFGALDVVALDVSASIGVNEFQIGVRQREIRVAEPSH